MRVKKNKKLVEELIKEDDEQVVEEPLDLDDASKQEIKQDIEQAAEEENKSVDNADASAMATEVDRWAGVIRNPYGTANPGFIKKTLQRSLDTIMDMSDAGLAAGNYPNVIIYGLAGFGKTSIVESFCKEHNLNFFEVDAKTLDTATVGGIPYPKKNERGELKQAPVASSFWDGLDIPNTVIFLDELNRAPGNLIGTLLGLVNNHKLPITTEHSNGKTTTTKFFPNVLFTVVAINPADDVFEDNIRLDPAMISRNGAVIEQGPDIKEFYRYVKEVYDAIAKNANLAQNLKDKFAGQFGIAEALLKDKAFQFEDADQVRANFNETNRILNYFNYRTFMLELLRSNGKKDDYLYVIEHESGFAKGTQLMIKNILSTYTDKATTGNGIFNKPANPQRAAKAAADVEAALGDFVKSLD